MTKRGWSGNDGHGGRYLRQQLGQVLVVVLDGGDEVRLDLIPGGDHNLLRLLLHVHLQLPLHVPVLLLQVVVGGAALVAGVVQQLLQRGGTGEALA